MKSYQLRSSSRSTRVYSMKCYSILGIDNSFYADNVFVFYSYRCKANFDLSIEPRASMHISSYHYLKSAKIPNSISVFQTWNYAQERTRFLSIPDVKKTFSKPEEVLVGRAFGDVKKT